MSSDTITLTFRPVALEDYQTFSTLEQINVPVLGVGLSVPVTPILTFSDDAAALAAGLSSGDIYIESGVFPIRLHCVGGGGGGGVTKLTGTSTVSVGTISDGVASVVGTITVTGANVGDPVPIGAQPSLPTGMYQFGKVTAANTVTVEVYNISGIPQTPGSVIFNATIIH